MSIRCEGKEFDTVDEVIEYEEKTGAREVEEDEIPVLPKIEVFDRTPIVEHDEELREEIKPKKIANKPVARPKALPLVPPQRPIVRPKHKVWDSEEIEELKEFYEANLTEGGTLARGALDRFVTNSGRTKHAVKRMIIILKEEGFIQRPVTKKEEPITPAKKRGRPKKRKEETTTPAKKRGRPKKRQNKPWTAAEDTELHNTYKKIRTGKKRARISSKKLNALAKRLCRTKQAILNRTFKLKAEKKL